MKSLNIKIIGIVYIILCFMLVLSADARVVRGSKVYTPEVYVVSKKIGVDVFSSREPDAKSANMASSIPSNLFIQEIPDGVFKMDTSWDDSEIDLSFLKNYTFRFPFFVTDEHHGVYLWLRERILNGVTIVNFDFHSDVSDNIYGFGRVAGDYTDAYRDHKVLFCGNWLSMAMHDHLAEEAFVIYPTSNASSGFQHLGMDLPNINDMRDHQTSEKLPMIRNALITIDLDYFCDLDLEGSAIIPRPFYDRNYIKERFEGIMNIIRSKVISIAGVNITITDDPRAFASDLGPHKGMPLSEIIQMIAEGFAEINDNSIKSDD